LSFSGVATYKSFPTVKVSSTICAIVVIEDSTSAHSGEFGSIATSVSTTGFMTVSPVIVFLIARIIRSLALLKAYTV